MDTCVEMIRYRLREWETNRPDDAEVYCNYILDVRCLAGELKQHGVDNDEIKAMLCECRSMERVATNALAKRQAVSARHHEPHPTPDVHDYALPGLTENYLRHIRKLLERLDGCAALHTESPRKADPWTAAKIGVTPGRSDHGHAPG